MLSTCFPQDWRRYQSVPILGPVMNRYASWLDEQQYTWRSARYELRMADRVAGYFSRRGLGRIEDLEPQHLHACHRWFRQRYPSEVGAFRLLVRFLRESEGIEEPVAAPPTSQADVYIQAFMAHLDEVRGYAPSTVRRQGQIAAEFLGWLHVAETPERLSVLSVGDLEGFTARLSKRMGRVGLQKPIAILRNFLRFLAADGVIATGLDELIDRPRVYRQEQLPRSLPWSTVEALLASIDRASPIGKRDFAIFSLMTTYGLRACDVVALVLDDIQWRGALIRVRQSKTGNPVDLPLTEEVSDAIRDYLRHARRQGPYRQVFLRIRAPQGTLKPTAVIEAFQAWSRRSGLDIPYKGAHCIRHSYALHLLRQGVPLKTIGDLLGHRSPESTTTYLRLATEDLRTVALPLPVPTSFDKERPR